MTRRVVVLISLALMMGCQATSPTSTRRPASGASKKPVLVEATAASRIVDAKAPLVELSGSVKIISDNGLGLISDNGLGIISNNSGGLISNNGGGLTSRYATLATAKAREVLLADATLQVYDAQGKVLVDAKRKALSAVTDKQGSYNFKGALPDENLVVKIRLFNGGTLSAILARPDGTGARKLDINTASTLGAVYVLKQYVKGDKAVFARLPGAEVAKLQEAMEAAAAKLDKAPSYQDDALVATTDSLRADSQALDTQLEHIKQLLLVGQTNLGTGLPANTVSLLNPYAVVRDKAGNTFIAESIGRIRKVDAQGRISLYAAQTDELGAVKAHLDLLSDMVGNADGTLWVAERATKVVKRIGADGSVKVIAGGGSATADAGVGSSLKIAEPHRLAIGADDTIYVGEMVDGGSGRVLKVTKDGQATALPMLVGAQGQVYAFGLAAAPDGTLYAGVVRGPNETAVYGIDRLKPGATAWEPFIDGGAYTREEHMSIGPDGMLYYSNCIEGSLYRVDPKAATPTPEKFAGGGASAFTDGQSKLAGSFTIPRGQFVCADGTILVVNGGAATVTEIAAAGTVKRFAGVEGVSQVGNTLGLALNSPVGMVADPNGDLVFSEGKGLLKRLKGQAVELVAADDAVGVKVGNGTLGSPTTLCYWKGDLYYADSASHQLRKRSADGKVTIIAGAGHRGRLTTRKVAATEARFDRIAGVGVDSQGRVWFTDAANHQLLRLNTDGQVELVAGSLGTEDGPGPTGDKGDAGPAADATLNTPAGVVVDKDDNVYVADSANFRIRKIDKSGTISSFAGVGRTAAFGRVLASDVDTGDVKAADALFIGCAAMCLSSGGDLYVTELGSITLKLADGLIGSGGAIPFALPDLPARIRKISPSGTVSIVAGPNGKALTDPTSDEALFSPLAVAIDGQGRLAILDTAANQIKILPAGSF